MNIDVVLERKAVPDKMAELRGEIAQVVEAIGSLTQTRDINISWRDQRWQVLRTVERALHRSGVLKDQAIAGYEDNIGRAEIALRELATRKKALEGRLGHCERSAGAAPGRRKERRAVARAVIARTEEAETGLDEIPETLRDLDEHSGEDAPPPGVQSAASLQSAPTADEPRKFGPGRDAPGAVFTSDTSAPSPVWGGTITLSDPVPAAAPQAASPPHRSGNVVAVVMASGLAVLGATGFMVAQGTVLSSLTASVFGNRTVLSSLAASVFGNRASRTGGGPEAVPKSRAAAVLPPAVPAKPKSLPVAYERRAPMPNPSIAPVAPQPKHEAPRSATPPPKPLRAAPARVAPSTLGREDRSRADRSLGKSLRQAGDVKILEGDIASARLFYKRAADAGDARAALYLGNSFNPAFLEHLGVLGMRGDIVTATRWYRRALSLGSPDAGKALRTLPR